MDVRGVNCWNLEYYWWDILEKQRKFLGTFLYVFNVFHLLRDRDLGRVVHLLEYWVIRDSNL